MQKPIDLEIEDFREGLGNFINSHQQLPMSVIVMIINEVHDSINKQYMLYKKQLRQNYEAQLQVINEKSQQLSVEEADTKFISETQ